MWAVKFNSDIIYSVEKTNESVLNEWNKTKFFDKIVDLILFTLTEQVTVRKLKTQTRDICNILNALKYVEGKRAE